MKKCSKIECSLKYEDKKTMNFCNNCGAPLVDFKTDWTDDDLALFIRDFLIEVGIIDQDDPSQKDHYQKEILSCLEKFKKERAPKGGAIECHLITENGVVDLLKKNEAKNADKL